MLFLFIFYPAIAMDLARDISGFELATLGSVLVTVQKGSAVCGALLKGFITVTIPAHFFQLDGQIAGVLVLVYSGPGLIPGASVIVAITRGMDQQRHLRDLPHVRELLSNNTAGHVAYKASITSKNLL